MTESPEEAELNVPSTPNTKGIFFFAIFGGVKNRGGTEFALLGIRVTV
jgi:hypothetical protein